MAEEVKNTQDTQTIKGWTDVEIVPDMPLSVIISFMNVLNQRLVAIENLVTIPGPDGKAISLSEKMYLETMAELQKQSEQAKQESTDKE